MQRVPPGFNELYDERARIASDLLGRHVLAVFRLDNEEAPSFEGSCVAVRARSEHFIVSAAHVLDATTQGGVHLLLNGREQNPLENPTWLTLTKYPGSRRDDIVDIGYVRLTEAEIRAIGADKFLEVPHILAPPESNWSTRHMLLGFPANRQGRDDVEMQYDLQQTYFTSPEIALGKYPSAGLNRVQHFAMRFEGSRIASKRGRGGQPNFQGMSGGGVWLMDPYTDYLSSNYPPFVGLLLGRAPKTKKVLFGSRIAALFSMLEAESNAPAI